MTTDGFVIRLRGGAQLTKHSSLAHPDASGLASNDLFVTRRLRKRLLENRQQLAPSRTVGSKS